jgi:hypothetical protein
MSETNGNPSDNPLHQKNHHGPRPCWKLSHLHWGFWVGIVCMSIALLVYIFIYELAMVPHGKGHQAPSGSTAR